MTRPDAKAALFTAAGRGMDSAGHPRAAARSLVPIRLGAAIQARNPAEFDAIRPTGNRLG